MDGKTFKDEIKMYITVNSPLKLMHIFDFQNSKQKSILKITKML